MEKSIQKFSGKKLNHTLVGIMAAVAIALPGTASAGWFSSSSPVKAVVSKVKATPGNVQQKIEDVSQKLNEIYANIADNRPLMEQMKNGPMLHSLMEVMQFINNAQQDYQDFANNDVTTFRRGIQDMLTGFGDIITDFPALENGDRIVSKLHKVAGLVDKLPSQFLFVLYQAMGDKIGDIQDKVIDLRRNLAALPKLPRASVLYENVGAYESELCKMVDSRATAVTLTIIKNKLKEIIFVLKAAKDQMPNDLTINVTVVGGGGFTATKHPAQVPFEMPLMILEAIQMELDNKEALAQAACKHVGTN